MQSIFDQIKGIKLPAPRPVQKPIAVDIVDKWKADKSQQNTKELIDYLKPTIDSALHTYTPGQQENFRIKATSMALNSLSGYDKKKNTSPRTYVFSTLQRLNRIRRQRDNIIHIPQSQVYLRQLGDKKKNQLQEDLGRQPSLMQLSDKTGISQKKLQKIYDDNITFSETSSDNLQTGDSSFKTSDLTDKDYYNYVYQSVPSIDQKIMQWSSGYGKQLLSNNEIAKRLRLSPGAVSQRKAKIQEKLSAVRGLL